VYTAHALARSYCHGERPSLARHHACDTVLCPSRAGPCTVCRNASWRHSAGSPASGLCYADDRRPFFCWRRTGTGTCSEWSVIGVAGCRASARAGVSTGSSSAPQIAKTRPKTLLCMGLFFKKFEAGAPPPPCREGRIEFIDENAGGPGVRLQKRQHKKG